jgi:nucleotide-binding universal stress UspA family protein
VVAGVRDENDTPALRLAAATAERRKASLRLISVWATLQYVGSMAPVIDDVRAVTEAGEAMSDRAVEEVRREFPGLAVTGQVVRAPSPASALVEATSHADLLVLGARRADHEAGTHLGRVAHAALHHAHCPVVIVPRP